jgi:uncharacterized membrane protein YphA (DoxX/SURF4 family)
MAKRALIAHPAALVLRTAIGALFVYAGVLKALDPSQFLRDVESYRMLSYHPAVAVALYLPYLEILGGASLVLNRAFHGGLMLLGSLTIVFTTALLLAWLRGLDISCGCFGTSGGTANYPWLLARDILILAAIGWLARLDRQTRVGVDAIAATP